MPKVAAHAWDDARAMYVEGVSDSGVRRYPSLADVATRIGASHDAVRKKAAQGKWTEHRQLFQERLNQKRTEQVTERLAGAAAELDSRAAVVANAGIGRCAQMLKETSSAVGLSALASALRTFHAIGRLIHGESTENVAASGKGGIAAMLAEARAYEAKAKQEAAEAEQKKSQGEPPGQMAPKRA